MNNGWLLRPVPHPQARIRLFCFHPAGKGASIFVPWARLLPQEFDVCCIQLPGRENRLKEAPISDLNPLLSALDEQIFPLLDRPFAIFGASMGALVGFELARLLRKTYHVVPESLFFASLRAPQDPDRLPPIAHLPDILFLEEVHKRYSSVPDVIRQNKQMMEMFLPAVRADFKWLESYTYHLEDPFDCPLTIIRGSEDSVVLPEDIAGWGKHTNRQFAQLTHPGGHFFFNDQPARVIDLIAQQMQAN